ncbi:hypothetical protein IEQ34_022589 [Dendrobium chrysotoxum]|uniref:Uncharacterized protein n=1 Tax=Dendrobium chrysotoxum TaxID=161865 RepID=A0AAV7FZF2_DENCH|nr:hypothetical protein IEQ34_022589 [Dendrobium chrysotoxum]
MGSPNPLAQPEAMKVVVCGQASEVGAPLLPRFEAMKPHETTEGIIEFRKLPVPAHRFSLLKKCWMEVYTPVYEQLKVDVRMNLKVRYCSVNRIIWNLV